jgi:hypothetical protein
VNTDFAHLIEKFKMAGNYKMQTFIVLDNQGKLLDYLKNFEKDETKVLLLQSIIKQDIMKSSKQFAKVWLVAFVLLGACIIYLFVTAMLGRR